MRVWRFRGPGVENVGSPRILDLRVYRSRGSSLAVVNQIKRSFSQSHCKSAFQNPPSLEIRMESLLLQKNLNKIKVTAIFAVEPLKTGKQAGKQQSCGLPRCAPAAEAAERARPDAI